MLAESGAPAVLSQAEKLFGDGQFAEAIKLFDQVLEIEPNQIAVIRRKADAFLALEDYPGALECHNRIIAISPNKAAGLAGKGDLLAAMDRSDEALECYDQGLDVDPTNQAILRSKAVVLGLINRPAEALELYGKVLAANPNDARMWSNKGDILLELGRSAEAFECYAKAAAVDPGTFQSSDWAAKGDILYNSATPTEAVAFYEQSISSGPSVRAWRGKGLVLSQYPARAGEALECFEFALELDPQNAWVWSDKGNIYFNQGKFEDAIQCYEKAAQIEPTNFLAHYNKGAALEKAYRNAEAVVAYDKAIELDPTSGDAWLGKGLCLIRTDLDEAIRCFDRTIELTPGSLWAWNNKGWAVLQRKKYDEAISYFEKAIQIDNGEIIPWSNKFTTLMDKGQREEALACLQQAREVARDKAAAFSASGLYYSEYMFDHEKALDFYEQGLAVNPHDANTIENIAECLIKLGRYNEGRASVTEAASATNPSPDAIKQCVLSYLVMASYGMEGDVPNRTKAFAEFMRLFVASEEKRQAGKNLTWNFRGLVNTIRNSNADAETKLLLLTSIDLQQGKVALANLSFFGDQSTPPPPVAP